MNKKYNNKIVGKKCCPTIALLLLHHTMPYPCCCCSTPITDSSDAILSSCSIQWLLPSRVVKHCTLPNSLRLYSSARRCSKNPGSLLIHSTYASGSSHTSAPWCSPNERTLTGRRCCRMVVGSSSSALRSLFSLFLLLMSAACALSRDRARCSCVCVGGGIPNECVHMKKSTIVITTTTCTHTPYMHTHHTCTHTIHAHTPYIHNSNHHPTPTCMCAARSCLSSHARNAASCLARAPSNTSAEGCCCCVYTATPVHDCVSVACRWTIKGCQSSPPGSSRHDGSPD